MQNQRRRAREQGEPPGAPSRSQPPHAETTPSLWPEENPPQTPRARPLTSTTEPRTASDTLCRSSAAVPGLLSRLVNLRTSAMATRAGLGGCAQCPGPGRPRPLLLPVYPKAGRPHSSAASAAPPSRGSSLAPPRPLLPSCAPSPSSPSAATATPSPREIKPYARPALGGGRVWEKGCVEGGAGGVEVTREEGGKWQPIGLRPQKLLLVQPHPGEDIWLLLFFVCGGDIRAAEEWRRWLIKCLLVWGGRYSRVPLPPQRLQCSGRTGDLCVLPTPQVPGLRRHGF